MLLTRTPHLKFGDGEKARSAPFLSEEFSCHQNHGGSLHLPCAVTRDVGPAARTLRTFRFLSFLSSAVFSECPPIDLREMSWSPLSLACFLLGLVLWGQVADWYLLGGRERKVDFASAVAASCGYRALFLQASPSPLWLPGPLVHASGFIRCRSASGSLALSISPLWGFICSLREVEDDVGKTPGNWERFQMKQDTYIALYI